MTIHVENCVQESQSCCEDIAAADPCRAAARQGSAGGDQLLPVIPDGAVGYAESVTRIAHFSPDISCQFLSCGIDTLDLGISVNWNWEWEQLTLALDREKDRASGTLGVLFQNGSCLVLPSGKAPNYRWHLQYPGFHLFLGKSRTPLCLTPNVYASINSRALWEMSVPKAVELVRHEIQSLGGTISGIKPSRCDLATDFLIPADLSLEMLHFCRVPSHVEHSQYMRGSALETFYQGGKSSPTRLRIYDKGVELAKAGDKWWFLQVWNLASADHVWRTEFQLRRPTLKSFGIHTLEDLYANLGALWKYLTEDWFSLRLDDNGNTKRCTIHPWWKLVQGCAEKFGNGEPLERKFTGEPADSSWYVRHCAGCLASFAAKEGLEDFDTAITLMQARIEEHWRTRNFMEAVVKRSIPLGVSGSETVDSAASSNGKDSVL